MTRRALLLSFPLVGLLGEEPKVRLITSEELKDLLDKQTKMYFIDVREPRELEQYGTIKGYVNTPIAQFDTVNQEKTLKQIPKDGLIVIACERGVRAKRAADVLKKNGYTEIYYLGLDDYRKKNYPHQVQPNKP